MEYENAEWLNFSRIDYENEEWLDEFSKRYEEFVVYVYKEVAQTHLNNFVVCPLSLHTLLGYINFCTRGETAQQIADVLHLADASRKLPQIFEDRISCLMGPSKYILTSASALCVKRSLEVKEVYKKIATNCFGTEIYNINFKNKKRSVKYINNWVDEKTRKRIKRIILEIDVCDHMCAMLINAVCFEGRWRLEFREENTKKRCFFLGNQQQVQTDMIETTDYFNYSANNDLQALFLEVPYEGNDITMTLILPTATYGLTALESHMEAILEQTHCFQRVCVSIPKFKIETSMQFRPMLEKMGITQVFEGNANFSRICTKKKLLQINSVIQKTRFEIGENQEIPQTSTTNFSVEKEAITDCQIFVADHPFLFFVKSSSDILFIGKYCLPPYTD